MSANLTDYLDGRIGYQGVILGGDSFPCRGGCDTRMEYPGELCRACYADTHCSGCGGEHDGPGVCWACKEAEQGA
jgi:hypothetical protein